MGAFGRNSYNLKRYIDDAEYVIKDGAFVPEMKGNRGQTTFLRYLKL